MRHRDDMKLVAIIGVLAAATLGASAPTPSVVAEDEGVRDRSTSAVATTTIPRFDDRMWTVGIGQMATVFGPNLADYDDDGRLDLLFTNHGIFLSLFQQQATGRVLDVAGSAGIVTGEDFHGAAFGDCDNDGNIDLYLSVGAGSGTASKPKRLYRNLGDGTFRDVAESAGVADPLARNRAASWADFDNDGQLDLFVNNEERAGTSDRLFHNRGGCSFTDVSATSGDLTRSFHKLGSSWVDYDNDGDLDVFSAGQFGGSDLYRNDGGVFSAVTAQAGIARNESIKGIAWGDYDDDGDMDLFLTRHYDYNAAPRTLTNRLYRNNGDGTFTDVAPSAGVAQGLNSQDAVWADFDNDADLDLFVVNAGDTIAGNQPDYLFENLGGGAFQEAGGLARAGGSLVGFGGGAAAGDYNADGFADLVVTNGGTGKDLMAGPHELLINRRNGNHWLQVRLAGTRSNQLGIGARVVLQTADGKQQTRQQNGGVHRWSQDEMVLSFGLAARTTIGRVTVYWPSGITQQLSNILADRRITIVEQGP